MTPHELVSAASLLYGDRWQMQLSRSLSVDVRLVRRWYTGDRPIPSWVGPRLIDLLLARKNQIVAEVLTLTFKSKEIESAAKVQAQL